jgi:predicted GNAT family N-acyltransferase
VNVVVREAAPGELEPLLLLREEVFCSEQGVPLEEERDAHDASALHLVAVAGGDLVGTCRLIAGDDGLWKLGRMAVRRAARGTGVGMALLAEAERAAAARGARRLGFTAQTHAIGFYRRGGYRTLGGVFDDAGIPHVWMERPLAG